MGVPLDESADNDDRDDEGNDAGEDEGSRQEVGNNDPLFKVRVDRREHTRESTSHQDDCNPRQVD